MTAVLEVCDYHGPYPGNFIPSLIAVGAAVRAELGLQYQCAFPAVMADRPWAQTLREAAIPVSWLPAESSRRERLLALARIAKDADATVIRSHFTGWDLEAALVGRRIKAKVVWNIHTGNLDYGLRRRLSDLFKVRMLGRLSDRVIVVSDEIAREARMRGFPASRVRRVFNGIDMSRFPPPTADDRPRARRQLDLPEEARVAVMFGWSPYHKGVDVVLQAFSQPEPMQDAVLVVVGGVALREAIPAPHPPWLRVIAPVEDVRELYAAADVFISASRLEAFSYAIGEAMAMELTIVSSDIPGPAAYYAAPAITCYPPEDSGRLRSALLETLDAPGPGSGNRAFVQERLALPAHVDGVLAVFAEMLRRP